MKLHVPHLPRFGLGAKLAGCLLAAVVGFFTLFSFVHQRLDQRHLETLVSLSATRIADIIHSSAWQSMLANDRERLYALIRDIGREPGLRRVRIINEEGKISHSTDASEIGALIDKTAEACYACHAESKPLTRLNRRDRARIFVDDGGHRTLAIIRAIENQPDCSSAACHAHPPERQILGVIDVHLALDAVDAQLAEHRWQVWLFTATAALLVSLFSLVFVWYFVHRPVQELMGGTVKLAHGDLKHRIDVRWSDELGVLAESFNKMAEELDHVNAELVKWAKTLEIRVKQKTAELEATHKGLIHTEKMASLGRLAATVAHEVNNPLFGMLTYARLTIKDVYRPGIDATVKERMIQNLKVIERESRRCGELMKNLLEFARQAPPQRSAVDLNLVVQRAITLVAHKYALAGTELKHHLQHGLPEVSCDAGQIQQVLIVLLVNAGEAVGRGGEVLIRTAELPDKEGVWFSVKDSGPGIPPEIQEKIFEPFFSTKDDQHRTGLGLAVAKGIIDRHGGTITVHSERGKGAEFVVQLPLHAPPEPNGNNANGAKSGADQTSGKTT